MTESLFRGIEIRTSRWLEPGGEYGYRDWRLRLARNLARASTGRWEPLTEEREAVVLLMAQPRSHVVMHPAVLMRLRRESRD